MPLSHYLSGKKPDLTWGHIFALPYPLPLLPCSAFYDVFLKSTPPYERRVPQSLPQALRSGDLAAGRVAISWRRACEWYFPSVLLEEGKGTLNLLNSDHQGSSITLSLLGPLEQAASGELTASAAQVSAGPGSDPSCIPWKTGCFGSWLLERAPNPLEAPPPCNWLLSILSFPIHSS